MSGLAGLPEAKSSTRMERAPRPRPFGYGLRVTGKTYAFSSSRVPIAMDMGRF